MRSLCYVSGPSRKVIRANLPDRANNPSGSVQLEDIIGEEAAEQQRLTAAPAATMEETKKREEEEEEEGEKKKNYFPQSSPQRTPKNGILAKIKCSPRRGACSPSTKGERIRHSSRHKEDKLVDSNQHDGHPMT